MYYTYCTRLKKTTLLYHITPTVCDSSDDKDVIKEEEEMDCMFLLLLSSCFCYDSLR
jgi:hypothetical protein